MQPNKGCSVGVKFSYWIYKWKLVLYTGVWLCILGNHLIWSPPTSYSLWTKSSALVCVEWFVKCILVTEDNIGLNDCRCARVKSGPQMKCCFTQLWRVCVAAGSAAWTWPPAEAGFTQCMRKHILSKCNCSCTLAVSAPTPALNQNRWLSPACSLRLPFPETDRCWASTVIAEPLRRCC